MQQRTLRESFRISGKGLHTGDQCSVRVLPADPDSGIAFRIGKTIIPALACNVQGTNRGTSLFLDGVGVHTVEHLLSALAGMWVDNAIIEAEGPEIPAVDGSSLPFVEAINGVGAVEQGCPPRYLRLAQPEWANDGDSYMLAVPAETYSIDALIIFGHPGIGEQAVSVRVDPEVYMREIASARTFCTSGEIEMILAAGLGRGGTEDNVIVVQDDGYSTPLRFSDEFVRHKILDVIGDLSLLGGRLLAGVTAIKSSHKLNASLARRIAGRTR